MFQVVFKPLSYVSKGDTVHQKMCEYTAAQSILFEKPVGAGVYSRKSYTALLNIARDRLGHIATEEELLLRGDPPGACETGPGGSAGTP